MNAGQKMGHMQDDLRKKKQGRRGLRVRPLKKSLWQRETQKVKKRGGRIVQHLFRER